MIVDMIHQELLLEHGGAPGARHGGDDLLESALMRARHRFAYGAVGDHPPDLAELAAAYLFGLAKNHGYVDGNKRVAFAAAATFLLLNGVRLTASEADAYDMVIGLAEGRYSEAEAAGWFRRNAEPGGGDHAIQEG